jgi:hypothetical protein
MPMLRVNSGTTNKKTGQDREEARCHAPIEAVFAAHATKVTRETWLLNLSPKVPRPDDGKFVVPRFQKNRSI